MRSKKGFTLAELLISLGIIAILASIAIPSIASVSASLTARNLDSAAEELFLYGRTISPILRRTARFLSLKTV